MREVIHMTKMNPDHIAKRRIRMVEAAGAAGCLLLCAVFAGKYLMNHLLPGASFMSDYTIKIG